MQDDHKQWALEIIQKRLDKWQWQNVPASIQLDTTKLLFSQIKLVFSKKDIALRIRASKATTLNELKQIIQNG